MLDSTEKNKIKMFLSDVRMADAIKKVLRESFMKEREKADIHTLASERIAINLLEEGFKELKKHSNQTKIEEKKRVQTAL